MMNNNQGKRIFKFFFIAVIVMLSIFFFFDDKRISDIEINRYDAVIVLDEEGNMHVSETWNMAYNKDYRVRFRDIDYQKFPENYNFPKSIINTASFDKNDVSVKVMRDGIDMTNDTDIGYSWQNDIDELGEVVRCEPKRDHCESIFIDTGYNGGLNGDLIFEYNYTIKGVVSEYSDISELNWVLFEYAENTIQKGRVSIHLPDNDFQKEEFFIFGHGVEEGQLEMIDNETYQIDFKNMDEGQYLEFRLLMPKELYPNISQNNIFIHNEINKESIINYEADLANYSDLGVRLNQIILVLSILVFAFLILMLRRNNKKYFTPHETIFKGEYLRELPDDKTPAVMSYVYYGGINHDEDITATLLDLIRRKLIDIDYAGQDLSSDDANFLLTLKEGKDTSNLLAHEKHIIHWFFNVIGDGKKVKTKDIENYGKTNLTKAKSFISHANQFRNKIQLTTHKIKMNDPLLGLYKRKSLRMLIIPVSIIISIIIFANIYKVITTISLNTTTSIMLLFAISIFYFIYFSVYKRKRSKESMEAYVRWHAFKNFLEDFGNFDDYPMPSVIVWEHYLVYAVSLKCADKVMEQLRVKLPVNETNASQSRYLALGYGHGHYHYGSSLLTMNQSIRSGRTNSKSKISQTQSSSSGSGGGFSGGSSFGGGGGGGRSR
ncbi:DUF2207 domain-containing protein [Mycoplasmatota bacterium]|nr:DUF2207 domain-containing protein [Mycoplasmatota bacterium]